MEHFISLLMKLNLLSVSYASNIEDTPINIKTQAATSSNSIFSFVLSIIIFFIVLSILFFLFFILNKKNETEFNSNKSIKILDKIRMDHNSNLFVIEIHNKIHVLGKTDSNMIHITEFADSDDIKIIKSDCLKKQEVTFQSVLAEQVEQVIGSNKLKSTTAKAIKFNRKEN